MPAFANLESASSVRAKINNLLGVVEFISTPSSLVADTTFTYTAGNPRTVAAGSKIITIEGGHEYLVLASSATTFDLQTAGGVKLSLQPDGDGWYRFDGMAPFKDGVTDNLAKLNTLLNNKTTIVDSTTYEGPSIAFAPGRYAFSNTINLKCICRLFGHHEGITNAQFTQFIFPASTAGIIVNRTNTLGDQTVAAGGGADGSEICGLNLIGARGSAFDATKSGIWLRARAKVQKCAIISFAGHGIWAAAGSDGVPYIGDCNGFKVNQFYIQFCRGSGFHAQGNAANGGTCTHVDAKNNDGWCIGEFSSKGNFHYGHHSESNLAGSYGSTNESALIGCYAEDGVGGTANWGGIAHSNSISIFDFTTDIGGSSGKSPVILIDYANGPRSFVNANGGFKATFTNTTASLCTKADEIVSSTHPSNPTPFAAGVWINSGQDVVYRWGTSSTHLLHFGSSLTTRTYGRSAAVGEHLNIPGMFLGLNNSGRYITYGSAAPTTGTWARGDVVYNNAPTAGGKVAWVCTTAGTPGTWKAWGTIDP